MRRAPLSVRIVSGGIGKRRAYASYSLEGRSMLAVWLDDRPSASKDQKDPDGWTTGASHSDYLARRLAELALAPDVDLYWLDGAPADWWSRIEQGRRRKASKAAKDAAEAAVIPIPIAKEIEEGGKRAGYERIYAKGRTR